MSPSTIFSTLSSGLAKTSNACDSTAGVFAAGQAGKSLLAAALVFAIATLVNSLLKGSIRIQTVIESTDPDTHTLHRFSDVKVVSRQERHQRQVKRGDKFETEYYYETVYDLSNFVSPDGNIMNNLIGMSQPPSTSDYPVRLHNGSVNGGTVEPPAQLWNPCSTTLNHKGKMYTHVTKLHSDVCNTLIGDDWDVYLRDDGVIVPVDVGAYGKAIAQIVMGIASLQAGANLVQLGVLISNGFFHNYTLPNVFASNKLGPDGVKYAKWWKYAYKFRNAERCVDGAVMMSKMVVDSRSVNSKLQKMADAAGTVADVAGSVSEVRALAHLSHMARKGFEEESSTGYIYGRMAYIVVRRGVLLLLFFILLYVRLRRYIFGNILKVEEGNDRPFADYVIVVTCALLATFIFRKYVYIMHDYFIRKSFKKKVLSTFDDNDMSEFSSNFRALDVWRIAI